MGRSRGIYGGQEKFIVVVAVRTDGKRTLGSPRHRWEGNIKVGLRDVGTYVDWIQLAQDRDSWRALVNAVTNIRVT